TDDTEKPFIASVKDLLEQGDVTLNIAEEIVQFAKEQQRQGTETDDYIVPLESVRLTAPISNPQKIVAIGQNYRDHCLEQNAPIPDSPIIFTKFPTAIIGGGEAISWDPELTQKVDYEAELGVVIGKRARLVSAEDAFDYVAGYLNANDVSARDLQFGDKQWVRGKSLDTFCPLGPYLVTKDEIEDPHHLKIRSILNGNLMQDSSTSNLIFTIPALIEFISRAFTLLPGDIILTGTPPGVGVFREPQVLMKAGDTITVEVEGLGTLTNPVAAWEQQ
ncbi:MAG: fumarylacetoacetate hydrolase family protein, partial [bacterium]|nr:fumarylacetoacetate hydrolase family protein [bacterium]